ncbi:hypothetical protein AMAG_10193 [Allomyces macrogynus ATCC 38327]|uniref:Uncharacterized protein n=1 Tax=Allomyces macrogynus (strain ATCC 38327) TaxID=578462 RepID=A0A0L0SQP3_ALLM3|nr:hypothetical protein AMAG_10193 [Allomyces macrogynus ATCC 38327]|eukprot:KNE64858.1 hypothetical protein AMAG_10193 [Allomyces macrogynus ATCC 38327]
MNRLFGREILDVSFPLERMAQHLHHGTTCQTSHNFWYFKVSRTMPYKVGPWTAESLLPLSVQCPKCGRVLEPDADAYLRYRFNGQQLTCADCTTVFSVNEVSARRFLNEIKAAVEAGGTYTALPGVHIEPKRRTWSRSNGVPELGLLLGHSSWTMLFASMQDKKSPLPTWETVLNTAVRPSFDATRDKMNLCRTLVAAYRDIATGPWSMDLVQAVLRQRDFARKIAVTDYSDRTRRIATQATVRWRNLLLLLEKHRDLFMVPTLDIDLAWHTHQLHPRRYADYTLNKLGAVLNHDDTIESPRLKNGFTKTARAWASMFNEPYACDASFRSYWTPGKVAAATIAAPVALPLLMQRATKHKAAIN